MEPAQIQHLFNKFLETFDAGRSKAIWKKQNAAFREFWERVIMGSGKLKQDELISIIQILDINASKGGKTTRAYEEAVCRAIIYQNFWEGIFSELKRDENLRTALDRVLKANDEGARTAAIDSLVGLNKKRGNALTGGKAVMLNCFLAAHDAFDNLSMVSLEHRYWTIESFSSEKSDELQKRTYGARDVISNGKILEMFRGLIGPEWDARTISRFLYSDLMKGAWQRKKIEPAAAPDLEVDETPEEDVGIQNFAFERHLEEFLIANWTNLDFAAAWELITNDDGQIVSSQYVTDVGRIDILVREKKTKDYVVIELKKNRATEVVVGQIRKYLGWINENLAQPKKVKAKGVIIVPAESEDLKYALRGMDDIKALLYSVTFSVRALPDLKKKGS
jgi:hypothetical protein